MWIGFLVGVTVGSALGAMVVWLAAQDDRQRR